MSMSIIKILTIMSIVFLPVAVFAGPFLVCDPQAGIESYEVYQDTILIGADIAAQPDGSLRYDLEGITPGKYSFTAKACKEPWGCSSLSDPYESPAPAQKPGGLRMIE